MLKRTHAASARLIFDDAMHVAGAGYLRIEDVRRVCHNLGLGLTHRIVKDLCTNAGHSSASKSDRIDYKHLIQEEIKEAGLKAGKEDKE